jgi:hypothetical protein
MWPKFYRDYKVDATLIKHQVEPGRGIVGCEMHDLNGWGTTVDSREEEGVPEGFHVTTQASVAASG